jgi:hypothetical protein
MFGVSHSLIIGGVPTGEWYMTLLRILGYVLAIAALFSLMAETKKL